MSNGLDFTASENAAVKIPFTNIGCQRSTIDLENSRAIWLHAGEMFSPELAVSVQQLRARFPESIVSVVRHPGLGDRAEQWLLSNREELEGFGRVDTLLPQHLGQMTGFQNRRQAKLFLSAVLERQQDFIVVICDIDQFQSISFFYGEEIATSTLVKLSTDLSESFPEGEVFELMGDHFMLWLPAEACSRSELEMKLDRLSRQEIQSENYKINLTTSFGVYIRREDQDRLQSVDGVLNAASISLNKAKRLKKSIFVYSGNAHLKMEYGLRLRSTNLLSEAIKHNTLGVFYQPVFCNRSGNLLEQECLARIKHRQGWIGAEQFLGYPTSEKFKGPLTLQIMETACAAFQRLDQRFSINLTPGDLLDDQVRSTLIFLIDRYAVADRLTLELASLSRDTDLRRCATLLKRFRDMGCRLALDDFGQGYSNLSCLHELQPDTIKLDGSLICELDRNEKIRSIVRGTTHIATDMGIETVAVHVHNAQIHHWVKLFGISASQGFLFGKPRSEPW